MNQDEDNIKKISVKLLTDNNVDYLEFTLSDGPHRVNINDSNNQLDLKNVFNKMIEMVYVSDVEIMPLDVDESCKGGLLEEVFKEYVQDLSGELNQVRDDIRAKQEDGITAR